MLPKRFRLPMHTRLESTISISSPLFHLKVRSSGLPYSRFAFVISKKVATRATARNRTKRAYRQCMQKHMDEIAPGYDMLFILRKVLVKGDAEVSCSQILQELQRKLLTNN